MDASGTGLAILGLMGSCHVGASASETAMTNFHIRSRADRYPALRLAAAVAQKGLPISTMLARVLTEASRPGVFKFRLRPSTTASPGGL
jgi:hypothetical protein